MDTSQKEIFWYKKHGKYKDRITVDSNGLKYVIGDWAWNRKNADRKEYIEDKIHG